MDDLPEEVPGPQGRILFRHPNRKVSFVTLVISLAFIAMAFVSFKGSGGLAWPLWGSGSPEADSHRFVFLLGSAACGLIGLLSGVLSVILVWTHRYMEIDVDTRTLVDVKRTPFQRRSKEHGPATIERIVVLEMPPSDNDASPIVPNCRVEIRFHKGADLVLGTGSDWRAKRLARRIADLTGAELGEEKVPR